MPTKLQDRKQISGCLRMNKGKEMGYEEVQETQR